MNEFKVIKTKLTLPLTKYIKISEHKPGDTLLIGEYKGVSMVPNFNKDGEVSLHAFSTDDGEVRLNGSRLLDGILKEVSLGTTLEIVYTGKEPGVSKDGKKFKRNTFEVIKCERVE